MVKLPGL